MNRMFKPLSVALVLGISIAAAVAADPQPGAGKHPHRERLREALKLTDEQELQIKNLHHQEREQLHARIKELREAQRALRAQVFADNPDNAQIESLKGKIAGMQAEQLAARVERERKVAAILTSEQRKTMASMPHQFLRFQHRRHHRGPRAGSEEPAPAQ
jgi:Spy/CpxP family protein refolding chaperone